VHQTCDTLRRLFLCVLFIAVTSQLEDAVGEDLMTSHVTWQDIITLCKQREKELEQEEYRNMAYSIESLSATVCDVFQHRQATDSDGRCDKLDREATAAAAGEVDAEDGDTEEYSQILD